MNEPAAAGEPLCVDTQADVTVIGAGIAGLSVAYALTAAGMSVVVLDSGTIGGGETCRSTAHLVTALDRRYFTLQRQYGLEASALLASSHRSAIDWIESVVETERIDCQFLRVDGYLCVPDALHERAVELIERELAAASRAGVWCMSTRHVPGVAAAHHGMSLRFPQQAQIDPVRFARGLAGLITARGGRIYTGTRALSIAGGATASVLTARGHRVRSKAIVVATHAPINNRVALHVKQTPHRSYVIGMSIPRDDIPPLLMWDGFWIHSDTPYHYVRRSSGSGQGADLLIIGGEDHPTGRPDDTLDRFARLEQWARAFFPTVQDVRYRWSGQILEPHDELAYVGRNPGSDDNVFVVTGDSGNGMTHAAIAALMLPDLIHGRDHPWRRLYSPSRLPFGAPLRAAAETAKTVVQYSDWLAPHPAAQASQLQPGDGVVVRVAGSLQAVTISPTGERVTRSAVCPHLKSVVRWNAVERSWDCPCHGSRFDPRGRVLCGPAKDDLAIVAAAPPAPPAPKSPA